MDRLTSKTLAFLVALALIALAGCGNDEQQPQAKPQPAAETPPPASLATRVSNYGIQVESKLRPAVILSASVKELTTAMERGEELDWDLVKQDLATASQVYNKARFGVKVCIIGDDLPADIRGALAAYRDKTAASLKSRERAMWDLFAYFDLGGDDEAMLEYNQRMQRAGQLQREADQARARAVELAKGT